MVRGDGLLTVATWLWQGWRPIYLPDHVRAVQHMVARHLRVPHRFVCVTDTPIEDVECLPLWGNPPGLGGNSTLPNCYRRLRLFDMPGDWLSIDLDCVITSDITSLIPGPEVDFKILEGKAAPYNGSLWFVRGGVRPDVWRNLTPDLVLEAKAQRYGPLQRKPIGSDQVVMSYLLPNAATWGAEDGIYQYVSTRECDMIGRKIVFFAGRQKPWQLSEYRDLFYGVQL